MDTTAAERTGLYVLSLIGHKAGKKPEEIELEDIRRGILVVPKGERGWTGVVEYNLFTKLYSITHSNTGRGRRHTSFLDLHHDLSSHYNFYSL